MLYEVKYNRKILKFLKKLPPFYVETILSKTKELESNPRTQGIKLKGSSYYRVRVGNYRIIYDVKDAVRIVEIIKIDHRRQVYDNL